MLTGYSSVGRAVDCRSIGHLFKSGYPDLRNMYANTKILFL